MQRTYQLVALIERETDGCAALCPDPHVAGQAHSADEAKRNLTEALELLVDCPDPPSWAVVAQANPILEAPEGPVSRDVRTTHRPLSLGGTAKQ